MVVASFSLKFLTMSGSRIKKGRKRNIGHREAPADESQPSSVRSQRFATARPYIVAAIAIIATTIAGYYFWQQMRPGMTHFRQGMAYASAGRGDLAEQEWKTGIAHDPNFLPCYLALGHAYDLQKRCQDSANVYQSATKQFPADGQLYLMLERSDVCTGDADGMEAAGRRAAELLPNNAAAQGEYADIESSLSHYANAYWGAQRAHRLDPGNREYLLELVRQQVWRGDLAQASQNLSGYLVKHPEDGFANHTMAVIYQGMPQTPENLQQAINYEEQAYKLMPADVRVATTLGQLYLATGRTKDAVSVYLQGQKASPQSVAMAQGLLTCYSRLGDSKSADREAKLVQTITDRQDRMTALHDQLVGDPENISASLELARLNEENGDMEGAYQQYAKLIRQMPQNPRARAALADFCVRRHRPDLAEKVKNPEFIPEADVVVQ